MLFAYRIVAGQESIVADLLHEKIKKTKAPIKAIIVSPKLRGYLMMESLDEIEAHRIIANVPHVKGTLHRSMPVSEIAELLQSKPVEIILNKGDLIEVTGGPFKGERAKVVRVDKEKDDVTIELVEVAVPIPVTIKLNTVRLVSAAGTNP